MSAITNKEIKAEALRRLKGNWGNCIALTVFILAFVFFLALCEVMIYLVLTLFDAREYYSMSFMLQGWFGRFFIGLRILLLFVLIMPELYIARRLYIEIANGKSFVESRQYIQNNFKKIVPRGLVTALVTSMLKLFGTVPLLVGIYEVYYWGWVCKLNELTSWGLFCFMLSLGFTFVWAGVLIHYCISLCLTNYIMTLNPRANIFDACDLSVRLMEGKHSRYLSFVFSFAKFIPLLILFYPLFAIVPYYMVSYIVFMEDLMGSYWQDKLPAMIQRWNKHHKNNKER